MNSRIEEKDTPPAVLPLLNPNTGWVDLASLPQTSRLYTFGKEFIPFLQASTQIRLLIEHLMGAEGAGQCKRLWAETAAEISKNFLPALLPEGGIKPDYLASADPNCNLDAWGTRYKAFCEKQKVKGENVGINLNNIPYKAGPEQIRKLVEDALDAPGAIKAMDPWWKKESWSHDGAVTIYLSEKNARELLSIASRQELKLFWTHPMPKDWVIKAWPHKKSRLAAQPLDEPPPDAWA